MRNEAGELERNEMQDKLQGANIVKLIKSLRLSLCRHIEKRITKECQKYRQNGRKKFENKTTERWTDEFEEDVKTMRIRNWHRVVRDRKEWRGNVLAAKFTTDCSG
jgi:hypothetical protein